LLIAMIVAINCWSQPHSVFTFDLRGARIDVALMLDGGAENIECSGEPRTGAKRLVTALPEVTWHVLPADLHVGDRTAGVAGQWSERGLGVSGGFAPLGELTTEPAAQVSHLD